MAEFDAWWNDEGGRIELGIPRSHYVKTGLLQGVFLPILMGILFVLIASGAQDVGLTVAMAVACGGLSLLGLGIGLNKLLRAPTLSDRSRVVIDLDRSAITTTSRTIPTSAVTAVVLHQPNSQLKWLAITAHLRSVPEGDNPFEAPAGGTVDLLTFIDPKQGEPAADLGRLLASRLGTGFRAEGGAGSPPVLGMSRNAASSLAYLPVQGIFLFFSLAILAISDDPVARYHARQSLTLFGVELLLLGGPILLVVASAVWEVDVGLVIGIVALVGVALLRFGVRFYALWRAQKGRAWEIPGIRSLVGPAPQEALA